jgi:hypothetical protein
MLIFYSILIEWAIKFLPHYSTSAGHRSIFNFIPLRRFRFSILVFVVRNFLRGQFWKFFSVILPLFGILLFTVDNLKILWHFEK